MFKFIAICGLLIASGCSIRAKFKKDDSFFNKLEEAPPKQIREEHHEVEIKENIHFGPSPEGEKKSGWLW